MRLQTLNLTLTNPKPNPNPKTIPNSERGCSRFLDARVFTSDVNMFGAHALSHLTVLRLGLGLVLG